MPTIIRRLSGERSTVAEPRPKVVQRKPPCPESGRGSFYYLNAGIAADVTWIIGDHGGEMGTHAAAGAWTARVDEVAALPEVPQPF